MYQGLDYMIFTIIEKSAEKVLGSRTTSVQQMQKEN